MSAKTRAEKLAALRAAAQNPKNAQKIAAMVALAITPATMQDAFHRHLDTCEQCTAKPFELCNEGAALLFVAAGNGSLKGAR